MTMMNGEWEIERWKYLHSKHEELCYEIIRHTTIINFQITSVFREHCYYVARSFGRCVNGFQAACL